MQLGRYVSLAAMVLGLTGCTSEIRNRSSESELLRTTIVPQLLSWSKSDSKELELGKIGALQAFDQICFLWEYQKYDRIEDVVGPIEEYHGSYSGMVPENKIAFVGVRKRTAHIAHWHPREFWIGGDRRCVVTGQARLVKVPQNSDSIGARLEVNQ